MKSYVGTPAYMAPELLGKNRNYKGQDVDLFAVAVVLFIMYAKCPPFNGGNATLKDPFYKLIVTNKFDLFWKAHEAVKPKGYFSADFKELLTCMFQERPHMRLAMADLVGHDWMKGEVASAEEVYTELKTR